ncbi:MAG: LysM peptidoglycan-binding domain-containing protein, partial [Clostridiales bacterium]|nr:LysM peptidoglycan-binding domain-containing protein [Clostridiales bacterium]
SARVCASVYSTKPMDLPLIDDAYSTDYEIKVERKMKSFEMLDEVFTDTYLNRTSIELSGSQVTRVLDLWCSDITSKATVKENNFIISGVATISMIALDKDSQPIFIERQTDYEYKREIKLTGKAMRCQPNVYVTASDYVLSSNEKIDVRIEMNISASVYSVYNEKVLSDVIPDEEQMKKNDNAALTIYFSEKGESVWNIARKYNTTVEAIMTENGLSDDMVEQKSMLLIPSI